MRKLIPALLWGLWLCALLLWGCGGSAADGPTVATEPGNVAQLSQSPAETEPAPPSTAPDLEDGFYLASFSTDSAMFHVNEACNGKALLYSDHGQMRIHLIMPSKNVVALFLGSAQDSQKEGAALILPTLEPVTYSDGMTELVYGFDVPVPVLGDEFDLALVGTKGKWYDHRVSVSNPVKADTRRVEVLLSGGSGRAAVESPAVLVRQADGSERAVVVWGSANYEYMQVGESQYFPINDSGNSTFVIPVVLDEDMAVSALTVAMSEPHLIDYTLRFDSASIQGE